MIHLTNVSKLYRKAKETVRALDDVSIEVARGEFVAIRGPSGSGKSTLLSLVGALDTPSFGEVVVDGRALAKLTVAQRARFRAEAIGFVFQMFHLLPYLTVLENVLVAAGRGRRAAVNGRAAELLERFGLSHRITHRPSELSAGERQRVALARALLNNPALLLADEPTGNLDADNASAVFEALTDFHRRAGTVLLVTHDDAAARRAQRIIHLERGRML